MFRLGRFFTVVVFCLLESQSFPRALQVESGSSSSKTKPKTEQHGKAHGSAPTSESAATVYRNSNFGYTYRAPYGWVDRTKEMQPKDADPAKSQLLLAIFERPPQAVGDSVNSAVVITAESTSSYPGLKGAGEYAAGPLTELATGKGFKPVEEPYEFTLGGKRLMRVEFTRELGKLTMLETALVILEKGSLVAFTFIGGSEDEIDELVEKLSFTGASSGPH